MIYIYSNVYIQRISAGGKAIQWFSGFCPETAYGILSDIQKDKIIMGNERRFS